jgi:hypothetical protein
MDFLNICENIFVNLFFDFSSFLSIDLFDCFASGKKKFD